MKKILRSLCAVAVSLALLFSFPAFTARAGLTSSILVESAAFNGALSSGTFVFDDDHDIAVNEQNAIIFGSGDGEGTEAQLTARARLNIYAGGAIEDFAETELDITVSSIPAGGEFIIAYGLSGPRETFGSEGAVEFKIINENGYKLCVEKVTGGEGELIAAKALDGDDFQFYFDLNNDETITVTDNGEIVFDALDVGCVPEGYFSIGYTGAKCTVTVNNMLIRTYSYERPENVEITGDLLEDFDTGEFNINLWESRSNTGAATPSYVRVENGVLRFNNTEKAHFTTKYKYSNFELNFDLLDVNCIAYDENHNPIEYSSDALEIIFGVADYSEDVSTSMFADNYGVRFGGWIHGQTDSTQISDQLVLSGPQVEGSQGFLLSAMPETCNPFNAETTAGRSANIKIIIQDMNFRLYMKYDDEEWEYDADNEIISEPVLEYPLRFTPNGYIRFCAYGSEKLFPNFSIDNIEIINLDENKQVIDNIGFDGNNYDIGDDYDYTDTDDDSDLIGNRIEAGGGCSGSIAAAAFVPAVLIPSALAVIMIKKRRNR